MSSWRRSGIGSRSPAATSPPRRRSASPISWAKKGLPPDISWMPRTVVRGNPSPTLSRSTRSRASSDSGPTLTACTRSSGKAGTTPKGSSSVRAPRAAVIKPTCSSFRRRTTNWSTRTEGRSIHWMSSTATATGEVEATDRRHPRTARDTARWSARVPELGDRKRATSRARRCGSGSFGSASSRTGSRRSPRAAYDRRVSASTGRLESVR